MPRYDEQSEQQSGDASRRCYSAPCLSYYRATVIAEADSRPPGGATEHWTGASQPGELRMAWNGIAYSCDEFREYYGDDYYEPLWSRATLSESGADVSPCAAALTSPPASTALPDSTVTISPILPCLSKRQLLVMFSDALNSSLDDIDGYARENDLNVHQLKEMIDLLHVGLTEKQLGGDPYTLLVWRAERSGIKNTPLVLTGALDEWWIARSRIYSMPIKDHAQLAVRVFNKHLPYVLYTSTLQLV